MAYLTHKSLFRFFFFQAEDGIRDTSVTGVQTCALPISELPRARDLVAEPHTARAEDAPLRVQHDVRAERHGLRFVHLLVPHPRVVEAVLHEIGRASCRERV